MSRSSRRLELATPVDRIAAIKSEDPCGLANHEFLATWFEQYQSRPLAVGDLAKSVTQIINHQGRSRQYLASYLKSLVNTQIGEFVLTMQKGVGRWGHAPYAVHRRPN